MNIYQDAANRATENQMGEFMDRRLWTAVLLQALEDWKSPNMRLCLAAEKFFFESEEDFGRVCRGAGLSPESVLGRLRRMKETIPQRPVFRPVPVSMLRAA
jgi:hypothetical protein